jgi:hypothetical protein
MPYKEPAGQQSHAPERDALVTEEPDVLIGHVRICGGPGGQPLGLPGRSTIPLRLKAKLPSVTSHYEATG